MTCLIACLGEDKGILHVKRLVEGEAWTQVILVASSGVLDVVKDVRYIRFSEQTTISELIAQLQKELSTLGELEVAVNLYSGKGKEHMALLCALLKLGLGIRFVALTPQGVKELT